MFSIFCRVRPPKEHQRSQMSFSSFLLLECISLLSFFHCQCFSTLSSFPFSLQSAKQMKIKASSPSGFVAPPQDKYKKKLKDLKRRNREIEEENDRLVLKISRARKDVERLRAERSFLFQKLDEFEKISKGEDGNDYEGPRGRRGEDFQEDADDDLDVDVESFSSRSKDPSKKFGLTFTLPSSSAQTGPKKPEKDPNAPKKHMNAFKVYCQIERAKDRERFSKMSLSDQTRALGAAWKILSVEEKKVGAGFHTFLHWLVDFFLKKK